MAMTKKDYEVIANAIHGAVSIEEERHKAAVEGCRAVAETLAAAFQLNHKQFKAHVFMRACGLTGEVVFPTEDMSTGD